MSEADSASVREWTDILRRIRFGKSVKVGKARVSGGMVMAVALVLAGYADSDGTRVFPGVARVSVDLECDPRIVKRAMAVLRSLGLIVLVRSGGGHRADEYRLAIPADLLDRIEVLSPAQYDRAIERVRAAIRGTYAARDTSSAGHRMPPGGVPDQSPAPAPQDTACPAEDMEDRALRGTGCPAETPRPPSSAGHTVPADGSSAGHSVPALRGIQCPATYQDLVTSTTHHSRRDLREDVAVARAREPEEDPNSDVASCPHGVPPAIRCPACARGIPDDLPVDWGERDHEAGQARQAIVDRRTRWRATRVRYREPAQPLPAAEPPVPLPVRPAPPAPVDDGHLAVVLPFRPRESA